MSRDFIGYGQQTPLRCWPNDAKIAVQFVVNYEEGAESSVLLGDAHSEFMLNDVLGSAPLPAPQRNLNVESMYEYGSRAGFWRLHRLFASRGIPVTSYACGRALESNPAAAAAMLASGWEIASHGYRWLDYQSIPESVEREHIRQAVSSVRAVTDGRVRPIGLYQGKPGPNTRRLMDEEDGFVYTSDVYSDDLPYWVRHEHTGAPVLAIPYALDTNDMRFVCGVALSDAQQFFTYLKDAFDTLYAEGHQGTPKMMSIGLHPRVVGRPGRTRGLALFLDYVQSKQSVWLCRRVDIARHWLRHYYPLGSPSFCASEENRLELLRRCDDHISAIDSTFVKPKL